VTAGSRDFPEFTALVTGLVASVSAIPPPVAEPDQPPANAPWSWEKRKAQRELLNQVAWVERKRQRLTEIKAKADESLQVLNDALAAESAEKARLEAEATRMRKEVEENRRALYIATRLENHWTALRQVRDRAQDLQPETNRKVSKWMDEMKEEYERLKAEFPNAPEYADFAYEYKQDDPIYGGRLHG
jgi:gas vesicle protein